MGNNNEKYSFKQIQNNSNISNHENNINMSLSEIKEKNLKDEIQNIIQNSSNKNEPIDLEKGEKIEKKNKKKKKSKGNNSNRSENNEEINEIKDEKINTKKLEKQLKKQIKKFVQEEDEKNTEEQ